MSVAQILDLDSRSTTLAQAHDRWDDWTTTEPALADVGDPATLVDWTRSNPTKADAVLRALIRIGSPGGGDDPAATSLVCWALARGAVNIAHSLADLSERIDELTASYVWTTTREFDPTRQVPVAATILRETRRQLQAEFGIGEGARRTNRIGKATTPVDPYSPMWGMHHHEPDPDPADELADFIDDVTSAGLITSDETTLLRGLAETTDQLVTDTSTVVRRRGGCGLLNRAARDRVGANLGISASTVLRRACASLDRLQTYAAYDQDTTRAPAR